MLAIRKFKVCIDVKNGEFICPNPTIILKKHKDLLQNCEIKDGCIEFSLLQEDEEKLKGICIPYTVICEDCGQCPTKDGEICFCDGSTDCDSCSNCIGGLCQPKCPKECVDGTCVDCTEGNCPTNQECLDGKCQCPPNKPYKDANGVCYGCQDDTQCPPCFRCDGSGNCVPRDCGSGQCDPLLDKCVECVSSDACLGPNKCCVNNKCQCCPGFQLSPITGLCEPKPPCERKEDCDECEDCVNKKCQPVICPDGFKCAVGANGDDCIPDPCKSAPCDNGTDCGPECGCLAETCSECSKLTCADCDTALGCKCNPLTGKCEKVKDCDNPCISKLDCDPDCGCEESTCKDCANYTCEECGSIPGCKCTNGKCGGDGTPRGEDGCKDTFEVIKNSVCSDPKLIATLKKDVTCNCDPINFTITAPTGSNNSFSVLPQKVTGNTLTQYSKAGSPLTSDLEYKVSSIYKIKISGTYTEDVNGVQTIKPFATEEITRQVTDFKSSFVLDSTFGLTLPNFLRLSTATITITHGSTSFDENKCGFNSKVIYTDSSLANFSYNGQQVFISYKAVAPKVVDTKVTSESKRNPLFVWYEDLNNIVKREFVSGTTTYISELLPDLYKTKKSYKVTNDCSCKKEAFYIWDCEKEKYFETADITYEIKDCGKTFKLVSTTSPCNPLHKKEVYELFVNGIFFTNVVPAEAIPVAGKSIRYEDGITSIQIKVKDTTCVKDYVVEPQEKFDLQIPSICNPSDGKTRFTISENISDTATKIVSVKFGTSADAVVNTVTKVGGNFVIDTDAQIFVEITYSSNCKETIPLFPKLDCCNNCSSTVSGSIDSKILFSVAGETGTLPKIVNSCNYNNITYTSDNELVTISSDGIISYTTPNNSLDVIVTINLGNGCTKEHQIIFEKVGLTLKLAKDNGCDNPKLIVSGEATTGTQFKVRSSCANNQDVWTGVWGGITLENTVSQAAGVCDYELYSIGGAPLSNPIKVTYNKINVSTLLLNISQTTDNCEDSVTFKVAPHTTNLANFSVNYSIEGGAPISATISRLNNENVFSINRGALVNSNCSTNIVSITNVSSGSCVIGVNANLAFTLKCSIPFTTGQECINGVKHLYVIGPDNINTYSAELTFSNTTQKSTVNINTLVIGSEEDGLKRLRFPYESDSIVSATITPSTNNLVTYCPKDYTFSNLTCNKEEREVTGFLAGCLGNGIFTLSDGASNKIVVKNIIDISIVGAVSTNPNDLTKKFTIFVKNGNTTFESTQIIAQKVGNDIVFTIPNIPNFAQGLTTIALIIKEDSQYSYFYREFEVQSTSVDLSIFTAVSVVNGNIESANLVTGSRNLTLRDDGSAYFSIVNLPQHRAENLCASYYNGPTLIGQECKNSTPSSILNVFAEIFSVPTQATEISICQTFNGCKACSTLNIVRVTATPQVGEYRLCGGGGTIPVYYLTSEYPQAINYGGDCYYLNNVIDLTNESYVTSVDAHYTDCSVTECQVGNTLIQYDSCGINGGGPTLYFTADNFTTVGSAPESILYGGICYAKVGGVQGQNPNADFSQLEKSFPNCPSCGIFVNEPDNSCGEWDDNLGVFFSRGDFACINFPGSSCQPSLENPSYFVCR